jgi:hypothetical protein
MARSHNQTKIKTKKSTTAGLTNCAPGNGQTDASANRGLIGKRFLLAVLLMGASLTIFLWEAGGISYGDSARSTPLTVTANAQFYPTFGTPNDALVTDDGVDGVIQVPQYPIINCNGCPNCAPGTFDVAVTPDGHHAFLANEYGQLPSPTPTTETGGGTIGVIKVERDGSGRFTRGTKPVEPYNTIYIPGGNTIPGITMSHDGRYLYVTCEASADGTNPDTGNLYRDPTNVRWTRNGVVLCPRWHEGDPRRNYTFNACDNMSDGPPYTRNGLLAVIDVDKATKGMGQESIVTIIAAGCSPVRAVETADGQYVWVAARGRNTQLPLPVDPDARGSQVLGFNRSALVSASPNSAFVGYGDTHGTAPVGLALFNNDTLLAVANSNRWHATGSECKHPTPPPGVPPCTANVAIMDVSNPAEPTVIQTVPASSNDAFPRNVTVGPDDSTLYVPNADTNFLEVITTTVK